MNTFNLLAVDMLRYLDRSRLPGATLWDNFDAQPTPTDHYATSFWGLAMLKMFRFTTVPNWLDKSLDAFNYVHSLPKDSQGHHEFNNLARLLALEEIDRMKERNLSGYPGLISLESLLMSSCKDMIFNASLDSPHGNNWLAIQALCNLLLYNRFNRKENWRYYHKLLNVVLSWQLEDGMFYDWPRSNNNSSKGFLTPITYHAFFCALLQLCYKYHPDEQLLQAGCEGLNSLYKLVAYDGEIPPFGRSNGALFGYAAGILAFELAIEHLQSQETTCECIGFYRQASLRMQRFILSWKTSDGFISINPASRTEKIGWDSYMHFTVYESFAAAFLMLTPFMPLSQTPECKQQKVVVLSVSGLLHVEDKKRAVSLSLQGQGNRYAARRDPRYSGLTLLSLKSEGQDLLPPPHIAKDCQVIYNGFTPLLQTNSSTLGAHLWRKVAVEEITLPDCGPLEQVHTESLVKISGLALLERLKESPLSTGQETFLGALIKRVKRSRIGRLIRHWGFMRCILLRNAEIGSIEVRRTVLVIAGGRNLVFLDTVTRDDSKVLTYHPMCLRIYKRQPTPQRHTGNSARASEWCIGDLFRFVFFSDDGVCQEDNIDFLVEADTSKGKCKLFRSPGYTWSSADKQILSTISIIESKDDSLEWKLEGSKFYLQEGIGEIVVDGLSSNVWIK